MIAAIIAKTRRYIRAFQTQGAVNRNSSIVPGEHGISHSHAFRRLVRRGVIIPAGNKRYYLDEIKVEKLKKARRRILLILFISAIIICSAAYFIATHDK